MGPATPRDGSKPYLSKNKSVRLYKEKRKKRDAYILQRQNLINQYEQIDISKIDVFDQFPLTSETRKGLRKCNYVTPTEIQKETIGLALKSHDILGAAKTGSGKTLAFVIPILERLFCEGWCKSNGLGVLVITPTRELAMQIHEVCRNVGAFHDFTAGLVIGGKDLREERKILNLYNIVICTPGRLLQHMDENPLCDATNLQMLVLDEADRILDLKFEREINAILENLPEQRQTLLFSATQTKSVKDLARLCLKNPMYVSVHENAKHATPETLEQSYLVCEVHRKLDFLWSFLKSHKKQKILVFMATCKQVKYAFEAFCRMKPGISLTALYGGLHQMRRTERYQDFCRKNHVVMFATDLAARGLDFPNVSWVVQLDCPEDINTYIHRAGRTARNQNGGESLLILLPSEEESMIKQLNDRKIPINEIKVHPNKLMSIQRKMEAQCARDVNLKESAQRALNAYYKSVFLMKDKTVFDITKLYDTDVRSAFARSLGLALAQRIRFIEKRMKIQEIAKAARELHQTEESDNSVEMPSPNPVKNGFMVDSDDDSEEDFLVPKLKDAAHDSIAFQSTTASDEEIMKEMTSSRNQKVLTKAALAKKILKKKIVPNTKITFNEDGETPEEVARRQIAEATDELGKQMEEEGYSLEKARLILEQQDKIDKELYREKIRHKHKEQRLKLKEERRKDGNEAPQLSKNDDEDQGEDESGGSDIDPNNMSDSENEEDDSESASDDISSEDLSEEENKSKRKHISEETIAPSKKLKKMPIEGASSTQVHTGSLEDEESLALHFLTNS